jgi:uncharacterized protein YkwD
VHLLACCQKIKLKRWRNLKLVKSVLQQTIFTTHFTTTSPQITTTKRDKIPKNPHKIALRDPNFSRKKNQDYPLNSPVNQPIREESHANPKVVSTSIPPQPRISTMPPSPISGSKCSARASAAVERLSMPIRSKLSICALLLLSTASSLLAQSSTKPGNSLTVAEQYLLAAANQERANQGLSPLRLDPVLTQASAFHAREMADHATISHQFPGEPELAERGANAGAHFSLISENVGEAPTSVIIHNLWMHSEGHRANLLDPEVDSVGIAVVTHDHQLYAVEDFARTVKALTVSQQESTVASVIAQSGLQVTDTTEDARQTCSMSTGYAGSRRPWYIMRYTAASLNEIPSQLRTRLTSGRYHQAVVGACSVASKGPFTTYNIAVLLYP